MIRKLMLAPAILTLTTTPALARGGGGGFHRGGGAAGGFHGGPGGGFHGGGGAGFRSGGFRGGEFHRGGFRGGRERFERFHRFGFFGDFGFVGPAFGFGVYPFFWDPFWFPSPYLRATGRHPAGAPGVRTAAVLPSDPDVLVLLRRRQGVLPLHPTVPGRVAQGGPLPGRLMAPMFSCVVGATPDPAGPGTKLNCREKGIPMRTLVIWSTALILATAVNAGADEPTLETDDQRTLYALGLTINRSLSPFNLSPSELELVEAGLADGSLHKTPKVDLETYGPKIKQFQEARAAAVAAAERKTSQVVVDQAARGRARQKPPRAWS